MNERGATVVELLVSLALISVVFVAAGPLILQSIKLFDATGRSLTDPSASLVGSWLRRDIHSAASLHSWSDEWGNETLVLLSHDKEIITYEVDDSSLIRRRLDLAGELIDRRVILRNITYWRWRALQGFVDVQIVLPGHVDPTRAALIRDRQRATASTQKIENFSFSLRGRGGRTW